MRALGTKIGAHVPREIHSEALDARRVLLASAHGETCFEACLLSVVGE